MTGYCKSRLKNLAEGNNYVVPNAEYKEQELKCNILRVCKHEDYIYGITDSDVIVTLAYYNGHSKWYST
ncbi:MAG: hypothetical protein PHN69_03120 [Candidatus Pacebacteria bacterium]|nr:hypothetical protein [Candidatus Paceibacterota bacterium]